VAHNVRGSETIEFKSDLGGGKTTFVSAFVAALGSDSHVSSPTFTVSKEYKTKDYRICHYDFYRLSDPGTAANALSEAALDDKTICLIEWGGAVDSVLPPNRLIVDIQKDPSQQNTRHITFFAPAELAYLVKDVQ
jgi:tRNA threonylcarbamoyladenosine biosynthesis protein TsaE